MIAMCSPSSLERVVAVYRIGDEVPLRQVVHRHGPEELHWREAVQETPDVSAPGVFSAAIRRGLIEANI